MEAERSAIDDILRRRYWLKENFEWFMDQVIFHKEMKKNFSDRKLTIWKYGQQESRVKLSNEITFGSN